MPKPLFEVKDLRVAVVDDFRLVKGLPGPVTDDGEQLEPGWVETLPGVSYHVHEGEVLGMVGESASGKSLMLMGAFGLLSSGARVIGGTTRYRDHVYQPFHPWSGEDDEGLRREYKERRVAGTTTAGYTDDAWAELVGTEVGFLFQDPIGSWTPDIVIGEQSGEALAEHTNLSIKEIEERVFDALGEVGLPKSGRLFRAFRHELSRGMAQRAMLAAALTKAPYLLIADEPLNGLDPPVAAGIMELIMDMQAKRGMAMVFVSHDLAVVARIADRVAVVYGGEMVEHASVTDIYHHPKHPYTAGLVGSLPGVTPGRLRTIDGEAQLLVDIDRGLCSFADRCSYATEICRSVAPRASVVGATEVRCHHAADLDLPGIRG
ncbi:MAG: ABC transporter ATP-binding protein [Actinomycetota bacterium]|nr:ABC transporter ATP-binding protein [Actinomycetota bacterium]MDK1017365.1 ABC transporter ATP-binding protein [Actinomycetota bacterium]MDK1039075.1 ABC transporter ATP-binding protein [Actinomycetota bacterium]